MCELKVSVTVHMPDLLLATTAIAKLLQGRHHELTANVRATPADNPVPAPGVATPTAPAIQTGTNVAPVVQAPTPAVQQPASAPAAPALSTQQPAMAVPTAPAQPAPSPAPVAQQPTPAAVPTAAAPQYSLDAIARAGAALAQAGKMAQLQTLLQQFNVQAVTQLAPEQYGAFATALRGLGAQI